MEKEDIIFVDKIRELWFSGITSSPIERFKNTPAEIFKLICIIEKLNAEIISIKGTNETVSRLN
jgi:streptogramin lyase